MKNFKNILGAAVVAVAGLSAGQTAGAVEPVSKNKLETSAKAGSGMYNLEAMGKSLFEEHRKGLTKLGADSIQIRNSPEEAKKMAEKGSINGIVDPAKYIAFKITFMKNGVGIPNHEMTFITTNTGVKNKYTLHAELDKTIVGMLQKEQLQTSVSNGGTAINASGNASISITDRGSNSPLIIGSVIKGGLTMNSSTSDSRLTIINSVVEGPIPKGSIVIKDGRIFKDNKDITPDGVTGKLSFEERSGETFVNGKPLKK